NLLAVNAAVEAARAGAAGASFAVVAHEVRGLATSAHEFADRISEMVSTALSAVERGVNVVDDTSGRVLMITTTAERVSKQINDIHAGSTDQRDKLNSLYDAVMSIADVSSGNARLATETASASSKLADHGRRLVAGVENFHGYTIIADDDDGGEGEDEFDSDSSQSIQLF
ncbi:MAG: methyl-accepting chemotaxis protein, partial [Neomegalonema sp.]|nr:methyl-accepting chemotaxis protein [Neomegalonema sp.]